VAAIARRGLRASAAQAVNGFWTTPVGDQFADRLTHLVADETVISEK